MAADAAGPSGVFGFEQLAEALPDPPLAAQRALRSAGWRLSARGWRGLALASRRELLRLGVAERVDAEAVGRLVRDADPPALPQEATAEPNRELPTALVKHGIDGQRWAGLSDLERFALAEVVERGDPHQLRRALDEIAAPGKGEEPRLTHLSSRGEARMVDVGAKPETARKASAKAIVRMKPATARALLDGSGRKGDALAVARVAGIMAAKRTPELIPLCHNISLSRVSVELEVHPDEGRVDVVATAEASDRTGVEMEALVAATLASLTIYDMLKAVDRAMSIEQVVLLEKSGGRSGHYRRT